MPPPYTNLYDRTQDALLLVSLSKIFSQSVEACPGLFSSEAEHKL